MNGNEDAQFESLLKEARTFASQIHPAMLNQMRLSILYSPPS